MENSIFIRRIVLVIILVFTAMSLFSENRVSLENGEKVWFYYVMDPEYLAFYKYTDPDYDHYVLKYFNRPVGSEDFVPLSPGQVHTFVDLAVGDHVVLGFFVPEGKLVYPVKIISLSVAQGQEERRYIVHNATSNISVTTGSGILTNFVPVEKSFKKVDASMINIGIDNSYTDWETIPVIAAFSESFNPVYFTREYQGKINTQAIENSMYWKYGGTQIREVKAYSDGFFLYISLSTFSPVKDGLLLYNYLYKERESEKKNRYALEWSVDSKVSEQKIFFWEEGIAVPVEVGSFMNTGYYIEGRISLLQLPLEVQYELAGQYSMDFTSCFYDRKGELYEEFFFTTLYFRDIPGPGDFR